MGIKYFLKHRIVPIMKKIIKLKKFFGHTCETKTKKILMAGGFGYSNVGDEAQCNETANLLKREFPDYQIIMLTPNPELSFSRHGFTAEYASRVVLWGHNCNYNIFEFNKYAFLKKICFLIRGFHLLFNSYLIKFGLPTFLINSRATKFIEQIREASLFYFGGGGFLTGTTLSRLWDALFVCRICHILNVPVVMSGQTVGVWQNKFNEIFARWALKHVKLITVRDKNYSINDLRKLDLNIPMFETHDDALFCQKSKEKFYEGEYIVFNYHYWRMKDSEIDKLNSYVEKIAEMFPCKIVLLSMTPWNVRNYDYILEKYPNKFEFFEYDYDFKKLRRVIADSKLCITMKHHPIIFAYGEDIPVISILHNDYYFHKNIGAMAQYGQERFSIALDDENFMDKFKMLLDEIQNDKTHLKEIKDAKIILKQNKERFLREVKKIIKV